MRLGDLDAEMLTTSLVNDAVGAFVRSCLAAGRPVPSAEEEEQLARTVADDLLTPSSKLQPYFADPRVVSIRANNHHTTWITYVDGTKVRGPALAPDNAGLIGLIRGLAEDAYRFDGIERRFDAGSPKLDCALANGDRVFALMVVSGDAMFVIRRHNFIDLVTLEDLAATGMLASVEVELLRAMVLARFNLVITGGMGTGKTTLIRVCANTIPPEQRKVVLEDTWPTEARAQQMMAHLDIAVDDMDAGVGWATDCGAVLVEHQPQEHVRVMLDPAGHPFCLFLGVDPLSTAVSSAGP